MYNLYYLMNGRGFLRSQPLPEILKVVESILSQGGEITGIVYAEDDI